jgi:hypothetical protein
MRLALLFGGFAALVACGGKDADGDGVSADEDSDDANVTVGAAGPIFTDGDGDGFGGGEEQVGCPGAGMADVGGDCDDALPEVHPEALETCNTIDDNCDGAIDETGGSEIWLADADGDGFGEPSSAAVRCEGPGLSQVTGDCDDGDFDINPDAEEVCNGADDDCDGIADNNATDATTWYGDVDGDGFGFDGVTTNACTPPPGYAPEGGDCDDGDSAQNPAAVEVCDGVDNDCDSETDEGLAVPHYKDTDEDGWGNADDGEISTCDGLAPAGYSPLDGDCDETDDGVNPGAIDGCNGVDDDCDGTVDEDLTFVTIYRDLDGDGFGDDATAVEDCSGTIPAGWVVTPGDCDDSAFTANPDGVEVCDDLDNDCDGGVDEDFPFYTVYADDDRDGWGDETTPAVVCADAAGWVDVPGDCDDADPSSYPAAPEACDLVDNDCDSIVDEDLVFSSYWLDSDGDTWGDATTAVTDCTAPSGYAVRPDDCDDADGLINPGATERCNLLDDDCDGVIPADEVDGDGDGYPLCDDPDDTDPSVPGCNFASASYTASAVFLDTLSSTTMTLAWDGSAYWSSSGGSSAGDRLSSYAADGTWARNYAPGRDLRSVFTIGDGLAPTYIRSYASPRIEVQTAPGVYSAYVTLVGGALDAQSAVVWSEEFERFIAFNSGNLLTWDASGVYTGNVLFSGFGTVPNENVYPQNRGVATSERCYFTYYDGTLHVWDETGVRTDSATLTGAGTSFDSYFSLSYANGMIWVVDTAGGSWRGYDVGL